MFGGRPDAAIAFARNRRLGLAKAGVITAIGVSLFLSAWAQPVAWAHNGDGRIPGIPDRHQVGRSEIRFHPETRTYRVHRPGEPVFEAHADYVSVANNGPSEPLVGSEDAPLCTNEKHRIIVVYAKPGGGGPTAERVEMIRASLRRMNWKIRQESMRSSESSIPLEMKVDCEASDLPEIVTLSNGSGEAFQMDSWVKQQYGNPTGQNAVKYLIYNDADTASYAGIAFCYCSGQNGSNSAVKSSSDAVGVGNNNRVYTTSAIVMRDFWQSHVTIHELFHTFGATQREAPFASPGSHCTDGLDVLCYDDGTASYSEVRCPADGYYDSSLGVPIDCGKDTYFDARTDSGEWLSTYWNAGGVENPFLGESETEAQTADVDLASSAPGRLDLVARAPDNTLRYRSRTNGTWSSWTNLGGRLRSTPVVVSSEQGHLDVFARGENANILHIAYVQGTGWSSWQDLGGWWRGDIDAFSYGPGHISVYVRGSDDAIWRNSRSGTNPWAGWWSLGGTWTTGPRLASFTANNVDVFARGTDTALWSRAYVLTEWTSWYSLGATTIDIPEVTISRGTVPADQMLHAFVRGTDGQAWSRRVRVGNPWSPTWEPHGGAPITAQLAAIGRGYGVADLYARDAAEGIKVRRDVSAPGAWENLGGNFQRGAPQVASTETGPSRPTDIAAVGTDGNIYVGTYTSSWQGWQQLSW